MFKTKNAFLLTVVTLAGVISSCGLVPGTSITKVEPGYAGLKIDQYGERASSFS